VSKKMEETMTIGWSGESKRSRERKNSTLEKRRITSVSLPSLKHNKRWNRDDSTARLRRRIGSRRKKGLNHSSVIEGAK